MVATNNMGDRDPFDRLLEAMPRIAEAVNAFSTEKNQRAALNALVDALGISRWRGTCPPRQRTPTDRQL
jgi:hypothetical protein